MPELLRCWEVAEGNFGFELLRIGFIVEDKTITIGGKHKRHIKQAGVVQALLHSFADGVLIGLGFDDCQRQVRLVVQHDIGRFHFDT